MKMSNRSGYLGILVAAFVFLLICPSALGLDRVTVQLKWIHQAQFAGFYLAEAEGFYEQEGLEVTFLPGGIGIDIYEGVVSENVHLSVVGAESLLQHRSSGDPVKAIATTYRVNPVVFVAFSDSGIESPYDFPGKSIAMNPGVDTAVLKTMLSNIGVDFGAVDLVMYNYNDEDFISRDVDVTISFVAGSLPALRARIGDQQLNVIWPNDYGVHFYSDTIIVNDALIVENPDLILRFLRATLRGHQYMLAHVEEAIDATMAYADVQDRNVQLRMLEASLPLIYTGEDQIGWMRSEVWEGMYGTLWTHGLLAEPFDVFDAFTLRFLEAIYDED